MTKKIKMFLVLVIILIITTTVVWATQIIKERTVLNPAFSAKEGKTDVNTIWVGTFQIAWNELLEKIDKEKIEFKKGPSKLAEELNKQSFTKNMLSEKDYYIKVDNISPSSKETILTDIKNKFNIDSSSILDDINFKRDRNRSFVVYSMLYKNFNFTMPFDKIYQYRFGNSSEVFQYFGICNSSDESLNKNVDVLFYNNDTDFSVTLNTKEKEEVILYRTNDTDSFEKLYNDIVVKSNNYKGNKTFKKEDELRVPYINVDTVINYDELCNKIIKDTNGLYIANAIQNVKFSLNEKGGYLISEVGIKSMYLSEYGGRKFFFTDNFILFLKEKDKEKPYMALRVNDTNILVIE